MAGSPILHKHFGFALVERIWKIVTQLLKVTMSVHRFILLLHYKVPNTIITKIIPYYRWSREHHYDGNVFGVEWITAWLTVHRPTKDTFHRKGGLITLQDTSELSCIPHHIFLGIIDLGTEGFWAFWDSLQLWYLRSSCKWCCTTLTDTLLSCIRFFLLLLMHSSMDLHPFDVYEHYEFKGRFFWPF